MFSDRFAVWRWMAPRVAVGPSQNQARGQLPARTRGPRLAYALSSLPRDCLLSVPTRVARSAVLAGDLDILGTARPLGVVGGDALTVPVLHRPGNGAGRT